MGLYDSYKLANSSAIPMYEGSAGEDFIKVGQYKQGLYDQNQESGIKLGGDANEVSSTFLQDQGAVKELREGTQKQLNQISTAGDWENARPQLQALGQNFANRAHEIAAPMQQAAEYKKSLDDEKKDLTPEQKQALYAMSVKGYQGLQKNAQGQYVGTFNGRPAAKNIDVNKKVDEWLKDTAAHEGGDSYETTADGDMWIMKGGVKFKQIPKEKLSSILNAAKSNDQEYQAFKSMQGDIAAHYASSATIPDQAPDGPMKDAAIQAMSKYGLSFNDAYTRLAKQAAHNSIDDNASIYGINKYAVNNRFTEQGLKENAFTLKDHEKDAAAPFMIQGPDTKLSADEKDYDKLSKTTTDNKAQVLDVQGHIDKLTKDLTNPNLSSTTRTQMETELSASKERKDEIQAQANRAEDIQNYSKLNTARKMGYKDYDDYINKAKPAYQQEVSKVFPNGIPVKGGPVISPSEIAEAAVDGRLKIDRGTVVGPTGTTVQSPTGMTMTTKSGQRIPIPAAGKGFQLMDAINNLQSRSGDKASEFQRKLKAEHEDNIKDFAIQSTNIQLSDNDRKELGVMMRGTKDGIKFSEPGQLKTVDAPKDFEVTSIGTAGTGGNVRVQVQEKDVDGKPTGKYYDAVLKGNVADQVAHRLGQSSDVTSKLAGDILTTGSGARQLNNLIPGHELPLKRQIKGEDGNLVNAVIRVNRDPDSKKVSYNLVDKDTGDVLKSTDNTGEAGRWVDDIGGTPTFSNGGRDSKIIKTTPYNRKH